MKKKIIKSFIIIFAVIAIYLIFINVFIYPCKMNGMSMFPTTTPDEIKFTNRWKVVIGHEFVREEVVLFEKPSVLYVSQEEFDKDNLLAKYDNYFDINPFRSRILKRIVGIAGDHIEIRDNDILYINEREMGHAPKNNYMYIDLIVPENSVYVIGDNREHSTDSRSFGCIPIDKIYSTLF